jgi:hypothetical protein
LLFRLVCLAVRCSPTFFFYFRSLGAWTRHIFLAFCFSTCFIPFFNSIFLSMVFFMLSSFIFSFHFPLLFPFQVNFFVCLVFPLSLYNRSFFIVDCVVQAITFSYIMGCFVSIF